MLDLFLTGLLLIWASLFLLIKASRVLRPAKQSQPCAGACACGKKKLRAMTAPEGSQG